MNAAGIIRHLHVAPKGMQEGFRPDLEGVGAGLERGVVADGVGRQRGAAVPHGGQQVQGLGRGWWYGGGGQGWVAHLHDLEGPHGGGKQGLPLHTQSTTSPFPKGAQLTRWYCGGFARAYAASSALQHTRLGVTRAAWEKLNMEARPGGKVCWEGQAW